jgi:hypothetical protein
MKKPETSNTALLKKEFRRLKKHHREAIRARLARSTIGSSVGRVLKKDSKKQIWPTLEKIPVDEILRLRSEQDYKKWFEKQLGVLAREIDKTNKRNARIYPGYKWGHATKILCLYLRDVVIYREYFLKNYREKVKYWLYCSIDSQVMSALKRCKVNLPFKKIKDIDTPEKFYDVQDKLKQAASEAGVPRIWFDDNWADRT